MVGVLRNEGSSLIVELPTRQLRQGQTVHFYEGYFDERLDPSCSLVVELVETQPVAVPGAVVVEGVIR